MRRTLVKVVLVVGFIIGIVVIVIIGSGSYHGLLSKLNPLKSTAIPPSDKSFGWKFPGLVGADSNPIAYSNIRTPGGVPKGLPVRLKIPVIGVDSAIEDAVITPDGRMDVPAGSQNVAWFSLGPQPGQPGSAVIGGHFGITDGVPFVFYNLHNLVSGDTISVKDDKGDTHQFVVRSTKSFDRNADATTVFTSSDGIAHLNLITCEGIWNKVDDSYPERLVVFTDAIPSKPAVSVDEPTPTPAIPQTGEKFVSAPAIEKTPLPNQTLIASLRTVSASPINLLIMSLLVILIAFIVLMMIRKR